MKYINSKILIYSSFISFILSGLFYLADGNIFTGIFLTLALLLLATGLNYIDKYKGLTYPIVILGVVSLALFFPQYFVQVGDFKFSSLILPLLQIIMFGMGTTMTFNDFIGIIKTPRAVMIGLSCQFMIMPFLGFGIATVFGFPAEVAAGIVLIGSSPSGLASNVMTLIAKANIALSITITTFATILAPIITPIMMKWLGGEFIAIDFWSMMWDIVQIIIIPLSIGFLINQFFTRLAQALRRYLPLISMAGIALILLVIIAAGRDSLLNVGLLLLFAVLLHNILGYCLGYGAAKLFGMSKQDCRTIALEVGQQNGGLAAGLANQMGKIATVGLAPALFGTIMNISGSILAGWWGSDEANPTSTDQPS